MPRARARQSDPTSAPERLPGQLEQQPTLEARLSHLDRGQLQVLLQHLASRQPKLVEVIAELITAISATSVPSIGRALGSPPTSGRGGSRVNGQ